VRIGIVRSVALAWIASACAASGPTTADGLRLVPYEGPTGPAGLAEMPKPRAIPSRERGDAPRDGYLQPDGTIAERFTSEGEHVSYRFDARAGEASLFELACLGFSRGWQSSASVRIVDSNGDELYSRVRDGGASYDVFTVFVAPRDGTYRFELGAQDEYFRFTLVRHASLPPNDPAARVDVGDAERAYGYLADERDRARFALSLDQGEAAFVTVGPVRENHVKRLARARENALDQALAARTHDALPDLEGMLVADRTDELSNGELPSTPLLHLERPGDARRDAQAALLALPAGEARTARIDVVADGPSEGGLFALDVWRAPETRGVGIRVGDRDDDPVPGIEIALLHRPTLTAIARATTGADGRCELDAPPGEYAVLYFAGAGTRLARVDAIVPATDDDASAFELNLVYETRAE